MTKLLAIVALAAVIQLSRCDTTNTQIEQIRQTAVSICGFLPTAETVAQILAVGNPAVTGVSAIATAICSAVSTIPPQAARRRGQAVVKVNGVVIHGQWVR